MVTTGERIGSAHVWSAPGERRAIAELVERRSLFLFYLFDWSAT